MALVDITITVTTKEGVDLEQVAESAFDMLASVGESAAARLIFDKTVETVDGYEYSILA